MLTFTTTLSFYQKESSAQPIPAGQNKHQPKLLIKPPQLMMTWTFCVSRGFSAQHHMAHRMTRVGQKKLKNLGRDGIIKAMSRSLGFEYARRSQSVESVYRQPDVIRQRSPMLLLQFTALTQPHSPALLLYTTLLFRTHKLVLKV